MMLNSYSTENNAIEDRSPNCNFVTVNMYGVRLVHADSSLVNIALLLGFCNSDFV